MIGLGATAMEIIYCFIAFTGFASFFEKGYIKAAMELFSFVFMLFLGVKFLMAKSVEEPAGAPGPYRRQIRSRDWATAASDIGVHDRVWCA